MNKAILISGATGLIGRELVRGLIDKGNRVIIVTTDKQYACGIFPSLEGSIFSWSEINRLRSGRIDSIINLSGKNAGSQRWNKSVKKEIYDSRILSTRSIVDLIRSMESKPEVIINMSGVDYYGDRGNEDITEESSPGYDFLSEVCIDWESEAYNAEDSGVRVVIIRSGFVFSRNSPALKKLILPFRLFAGGTIGSGKQFFSWIHINDLVRVFLNALENKNISGAVNAVSPNPVMMKDLCKTIGKVLKRPLLLPIPSIAVKIAAGEMSEVILNGRKALPVKLMKNGFKFEHEFLENALFDIIK